MAKSRRAPQDKGKPGDVVSVPATADEVLSVPAGKDGETVQMTRAEFEERDKPEEKKPDATGADTEPTNTPISPATAKGGLFKGKKPAKAKVKTDEELDQQVADLGTKALEAERQEILIGLIQFATEHSKIAAKNGYKSISQDLGTLRNCAEQVLKRTNKESYLTPKVK